MHYTEQMCFPKMNVSMAGRLVVPSGPRSLPTQNTSNTSGPATLALEDLILQSFHNCNDQGCTQLAIETTISKHDDAATPGGREMTQCLRLGEQNNCPQSLSPLSTMPKPTNGECLPFRYSVNSDRRATLDFPDISKDALEVTRDECTDLSDTQTHPCSNSKQVERLSCYTESSDRPTGLCRCSRVTPSPPGAVSVDVSKSKRRKSLACTTTCNSSSTHFPRLRMVRSKSLYDMNISGETV